MLNLQITPPAHFLFLSASLSFSNPENGRKRSTGQVGGQGQALPINLAENQLSEATGSVGLMNGLCLLSRKQNTVQIYFCINIVLIVGKQ